MKPEINFHQESYFKLIYEARELDEMEAKELQNIANRYIFMRRKLDGPRSMMLANIDSTCWAKISQQDDDLRAVFGDLGQYLLHVHVVNFYDGYTIQIFFSPNSIVSSQLFKKTFHYTREAVFPCDNTNSSTDQKVK